MADSLSITGCSSYFRELSIDELPGLTSSARLATALAACHVLDMPVNFIAPAFGFQKNFPFSDGDELKRRVRPLGIWLFYFHMLRRLKWGFPGRFRVDNLSHVQLFHRISQW